MPLFDIEGISLPTGFETDIIIKQFFHNKQPKPFSNCIEAMQSYTTSSLYNYTTVLVGKYNQKFCLQICLQRYIIEKCQCYDITLPVLNFTSTEPPCDSQKLVECIYGLYEEFYAGPYEKCFSECPDQCNLVFFNFELSMSTFPTPFYAKLLKKYQTIKPNAAWNMSSYEDLKGRILAVNVYFDDISYVVIDEVPAKSLEQFIADIGGLTGLCLGTSLLSLVEIVELVLQYLFNFCCSLNRKINFKQAKRPTMVP